MTPRTYRRLSSTVDAALVFAVSAWVGIAAAFLASLTPPPSPSPAVSASGAFPRGGWVTAGDSSSPAPAPENAMTIDQAFLDAIAAVETNGNDAAINFAEDAHGRYQIRAGYLADGNAALGTRYTLAEMHDPDKAARIVTAYLTRYGSAWERRTGLTATDEVLARLHNGGPRGPDKAATRGYADRILAVLGRNAR